MLSSPRDNTIDGSIANRFRRRRFEVFRALLAEVPRPLRILDVGGNPDFWRKMRFTDQPGIAIVVANIDPKVESTHAIEVVQEDARRLSAFADCSFDVVFSNSVIEHVGDAEDRRSMAAAIRRVGRRYLVQTPNRAFPIEPHFMFPFFQFLPLAARATLLQVLPLAWCGRVATRARALEVARSVELLPRSELMALFPDAQILEERVLGLTKSHIVLGGWTGGLGALTRTRET